jgi:hypothetical protein
MKPFLAALLIASASLAVHSEESPAENTVVENASDIQKPKTEGASLETEKSAVPAPEPTVVDSPPVVKEEPAISTESLAPAVVPPAAVSEAVKENAVAPLAVSTASVPSSDAGPSVPSANAVEAAPVPPVGCVASLVQIVAFHEKEIAHLHQMIARWDVKIGDATKRSHVLEQDRKTKLHKVEELLKQNTKVSKKEASGLQKEIKKISKEIEAADREMKNECKNLAAEIRTLSSTSSQTFKDACQKAITDIQKP